MRGRVSLILGFFLLSFISAGAQSITPSIKESPLVPPKRWALAIGAGDYKTLGKLSYAASDARNFSKALIERFRFSPDTIEIITDDGERKPTAESIRSALTSQLDDPRLNKGDLFIFYFSGHGVGTPSGDYLMPTDATASDAETLGLPIKSVVNMFVDAGLKNVLFIADACRSGTKNTFGAELQELGKRANIAVLLSTEPGQRSYEYPQLGGGAFTSFLIRSLRDKELRDTRTGALWVSNVAESVKKKVHDFTERDYPTSPQSPTAWTERTEDILLGAFPDAVKQVNLLKEDLKKLDADKFALGITELANTLIEENRNLEAVDLLKTADALNKLDTQNLLLFGFTLNEVGRMRESGRVFARLAQTQDSAYFRSLAVLASPSREVLATQRVAAAKQLWALTKDVDTSALIWLTIRQKGSYREQLEFIQSAITNPDVAGWIKTMLQGEQSALDFDWKRATEQFTQAIEQCPEGHSRRMLLLMLTPSIVASTQLSLNKSLLEQLGRDPQDVNSSLIIEACARYRAKDFSGAAKILMKVLDNNPKPEHLLDAVRYSGPELPTLADRIDREARRFPYAWRPILAKGLVALLCRGDAKAFQAAHTDAAKYCEDELGISLAFGQILFDVYIQLHLEGKIDESQMERFASTIFLSLSPYIDQFIEDAEAWQLYIFSGFIGGRQFQLTQIVERHLAVQIKENKLDVSLRPFIVLLYMATGRADEIKRLNTLGGVAPNQRADWEVLGLLYAQLTGSNTPSSIAKELLEGLSPDMAPVFQATQQLSKILASKPTATDVENLKGDHGVSRLVRALGWEKAGQPEKAEDLMKEVFESSTGGMPFIQIRASQWLYARYRSTGRWQLANQILYAQEILQMGNPANRALPFLDEGKVAVYAGTWEGDITMRLDGLVDGFTAMQVFGKVQLELGEGKLKAKIKFADGTEATLTGTLDANGNASGVYKVFDYDHRVSGKFAPPQIIKKTPDMEKLGPSLHCLDDDLRRIVLLFQNLKKK